MTGYHLSDRRLGLAVYLGVGLATVCWLILGCAPSVQPPEGDLAEASQIESPEPSEVDADQPDEGEREGPLEAEPVLPPEVDADQPDEGEREAPLEAWPGLLPEADTEQPDEGEPEAPPEAWPGLLPEADMEQPDEGELEGPSPAESSPSSETEPAGPPAPPETEAIVPPETRTIVPSETEAIVPPETEGTEPPLPKQPSEAASQEDIESELERLFSPEPERREGESQEPRPPSAPEGEPRELGPPRAADVEPPERLPTEPVLLTFNWRLAPWQDVLEWLAKEAGLQLTYETIPPGTCNYVDYHRKYTVGEAMDVLNRLLLIKGYTLVRRDRLLVVVNVEDEIDPTLIRTVTVEELDGLGESELVRVLFPLTQLTAEEAQAEIQNLVRPPGSIVALPKSRQIWVTETAGRLRTIRDVLNRIEDPEGLASQQVRVFQLRQFAAADGILAILRQLVGIPADQDAAPDGSIRLALDPLDMRLIVAGQPGKLEQAAKILEALDAPAGSESPTDAVESALQVETYNVAPADPQVVLKVTQTLLAGSPGVRLSIDEMTGNLIALARISEHGTIQATLEQLQRDASGIVVIPLRTMDPTYAVAAIKTLFGSEEGSSRLKVDADANTRRLILRGSEKEIQEIRAFLAEMGETGASGVAGASRGKLRTLPFPGRAGESALQQIEQLWPAMRRNPIRVVMPSAIGASMRSPVPGQGAPPSEAPFDQLPRRDSLIAPPPVQEAVPQQFEPNPPASQAPAGVPPATPRPAAGVPKALEAPPKASSESKAESAPGPMAARQRGPRVLFVSETLQPGPGAEEARSEQPAPETTPPQALPPEPVRPPAETPQPPAEPPQPTAEPLPPPAEATAPQAAAEPAPIIVAVVPGGIMIACQDEEALDAFEDLLSRLAASAASGPNLSVFYLKYAKATVVAQTLNSILSAATSTTSSGNFGRPPGPQGRGGTDSSSTSSLLELGSTITTAGPVYIQADDRLNALIVQASPADADVIWELLQILDQVESPEEIAVEPSVHLIALENMRAEEVAEIVRELFQDRMVMGSRGGSGGRMSPEQMMEMIRRSGGRGPGGSSRGGSSTQDVDRMSIGVDYRTNTLIVWASESLYREVEQLVVQLDQEAAQTFEVVQVIPLQRSSPEAMQQALTALGGDSISFSGTGSRTTGRTSSSSTGSRPSTSSYRPPFGGSQSPFGGFGGFRPGFGGFQPSSSSYRPSSSSYRPSSSSYRPSSSSYRPSSVSSYRPSSSSSRPSSSGYRPSSSSSRPPSSGYRPSSSSSRSSSSGYRPSSSSSRSSSSGYGRSGR